MARAWEEIYIAEGSDWFWWYGDDHCSAQDGLFDHLFRKHLRNVYALLGCDPPGFLFTPISQAGSHRPINDQPTSFLNVKVDGRATYFEWIDGARYACGNDRGTMTLVTKGLLQCVWFGFDAERFLVRVDTEGGPAAERLAEVDRLRIGFVDPAEREIVVVQPAVRHPVAYLNHAGRPLVNGTTVAGGHRTDPRAGRRLRPSRSQARRPGPVLCRAAQGRYQPRPRPPRGNLRAHRPLRRLRAHHVAGVSDESVAHVPTARRLSTRRLKPCPN